MTPQENLIEKQDELIQALYQKIDATEALVNSLEKTIKIQAELIENGKAQIDILKKQNNTLMSIA